jgi:dihydrofolate synthase/folylpolyglutamate synthase
VSNIQTPHQNTLLDQSLADLLGELYALRRSDATPGLERARELAAQVGHPQKHFSSIHIAGTNGKGTVSSVLASVLKEAGLKVGLYTSPHIVRFNERIRVNGEAISNDALLALVQGIMPLVRAQNAIFFEAATIMAFQHFANENVDVAVIETGLGGCLDATNILEPKNVLLTAITSIDFDHTEFLGETLPEIAGEKAGIMKQNVPCIIAEPRPELLLTFMEHSAEKQVPICLLDDAYRVGITRFNPDFSMNLSLAAPKLTLEDVRVNLCGTHQARNVLTAFALVQQLQKRFPVSIDTLQRGLTRVKENSGLRGRIEVLRPPTADIPPIVLDVAHNPAGIQMLVETLRSCGYGEAAWNVVFGAMQDKRIEPMLETLSAITHKLYVPHIQFPRARTNASVIEIARAHGIAAEAYSSVEEAFSEASTHSAQHQAPMLIAGSFHLAEEILGMAEYL